MENKVDYKTYRNLMIKRNVIDKCFQCYICWDYIIDATAVAGCLHSCKYFLICINFYEMQ